MTRENILFTIIGVLLGFIVGFMFASSMNQRYGPGAPVPITGSQNLPADHPPIVSPGAAPGAGAANPQGMQAEVTASLEQARSEPNNFEAQMRAAELYYQIQRYDDAIGFLLKANQIRPDNYETIVALGRVNLDAENYETSEKWYKAALLKKPNDVGVLASLAFTALQRGNATDAEKAIANLEKVDPNNADLSQFRERLATLKAN